MALFVKIGEKFADLATFES